MAAKSTEPVHIDGQLTFLDTGVEETAAPSDLADASAADVDAAPNSDEVDSDPTNLLTGPNTRIRAGNVMHRARAGAVRGAIDAIARRGLRGLTMVEAADRGGLARATLYNHVRDKDALLDLVLTAELERLGAILAVATDLAAGLAAVADEVADHPAIAGIRAHDQAALGMLAAADGVAVRAAVADALATRGRGADATNVDLVLRWLASFVTVPADAATRRAQARTLARTLG